MMLTIEEYMKKTRVSKKKYVLEWVSDDLIPGTICENGECLFPDSARRPYKARATKPNAKTIRTSIVNACLKKQHVTNKTFHLSEGEFNGFIRDLVNAGLIVERVEDGITYYDSTMKSDEFKANKFEKLSSNVNKIVQTVGTVSAAAANAITIINTLL